MKFERLIGTRASDLRPTVDDRDRVCAADGCATVLSRYNTDRLCAACAALPVHRTQTRRRRRPVWSDVESALAEREPADECGPA